MGNSAHNPGAITSPLPVANGGTSSTTAAAAANALSAVGSVVQSVISSTSAVATGTTVTPIDDTIPQNTEGDEYITCAITPTNASNRLIIEFSGMVSPSVLAIICAALFQDSGANALRAICATVETATGVGLLVLRHEMAAGTTASTTFKIRCGMHTAGTLTLNGATGGRYYGGVAATTLRVTEVRA